MTDEPHAAEATPETALRKPEPPARAGIVYLVGAGPGDPELLTLRAQRYLAEADVVFYDALVHGDVLRHCRPGTKLVFVGKRAGRASQRQSDINDQLRQAARAGLRVVRLKGGDPYLFGRGSEEAEFLAHQEIAFEVVPGVPSPTAVADYAGIPLSHRTLSSSVAFLTATESAEKDASSHNWAKLATATQTLVIFMGLRKIDSLMQLLLQHGRAPETPAAVVQWASLPIQKTVVGTVATIAKLTQQAEVGMPALTIVGDVVRLKPVLDWYTRKPLFGQRVIVTRPRQQVHELAVRLRDEGADVIALPAIELQPPADRGPLERALTNLHGYDWVVFTSANAVHAVLEALHQAGRDVRAMGGAQVCAIGPATAAALAEYHLRADVVPAEYRAEGVLAALMPRAVPQSRMLLPRAEQARAILPESLRAAGHHVDVVTAYRTQPDPEFSVRLCRLLVDERIDVITLTSSSTAHAVADALERAELTLPSHTRLACIGPITADTVRERGLTPHIVASEFTAEGLAQALIEAMKTTRATA